MCLRAFQTMPFVCFLEPEVALSFFDCMILSNILYMSEPLT